MKLHVGLHLGGQLPEFVALTRGHESDLGAGRRFAFPAGSVVVCDKSYVDYGWYRALTDRGVCFVTRMKARAVYRVAAVRNGMCWPWREAPRRLGRSGGPAAARRQPFACAAQSGRNRLPAGGGG